MVNRMVPDTYSVSTGTALTSAQLATIMSTGTSTISAGNVLTDSNHGFSTSTLVGTGAIQSNPNYVLVLATGTTNVSYTYFGVDVSVVTNP